MLLEGGWSSGRGFGHKGVVAVVVVGDGRGARHAGSVPGQARGHRLPAWGFGHPGALQALDGGQLHGASRRPPYLLHVGPVVAVGVAVGGGGVALKRCLGSAYQHLLVAVSSEVHLVRGLERPVALHLSSHRHP